jgi:hypothetical protein
VAIPTRSDCQSFFDSNLEVLLLSGAISDLTRLLSDIFVLKVDLFQWRELVDNSLQTSGRITKVSISELAEGLELCYWRHGAATVRAGLIKIWGHILDLLPQRWNLWGGNLGWR